MANNSIENCIEYIRCEIEIRVESLKNELDQFYEQFVEKLYEIKNKIIGYVYVHCIMF